MIKNIKGDIIDIFSKYKTENEVYLCHGLNCVGKIDGLAAKINKKLPQLIQADRDSPLSANEKKGSLTTHVFENKKKIGVNLYTQYDGGSNFELSLLNNSLGVLKTILNSKNSIILLPKIGSGIGGGNWDEILKVIQQQLEGYKVVIVEYEKKE